MARGSMPQLSKKEIQQLILESLQELIADIKKTRSNDKDEPSDDEEERRDFRKDPIKVKNKFLLLDDEDQNESNILELGANLDESGEPVCEGCLVAYMNEHVGMLEEAKYKGRTVPLGRPMPGDVKKSKVYVKDPKTGNVKKVNFGDPNMKIKKNNPARRKSFRARHKCSQKKDRTTPGFWSCRAWE